MKNRYAITDIIRKVDGESVYMNMTLFPVFTKEEDVEKFRVSLEKTFKCEIEVKKEII